MRVVCDTNVLIAGVVADGLCRDIVKRRLPRVELVTSRALLDELARTLSDKFDTSLDDLPLFQVYRERSTVVRRVALPRPVCRDKDDDKVLETAVAGHADVILTGDQDLLVLKEYRGIAILSRNFSKSGGGAMASGGELTVRVIALQ